MTVNKLLRAFINQPNSNSFKTEGTTQTFGQLINLSKNTGGVVKNKTTSLSAVKSPTDAIKPPPSVAPGQSSTYSVLPSSLKNQEEIDRIIKESSKVDFLITVKSVFSDDVEFSTLAIPEMKADFVYNFFEDTEENASIQEDKSLDPLFSSSPNDIPKYMKLEWQSSVSVEKVDSQKDLTTEEKALRDEVFTTARGTSDYVGNSSKDSLNNSSKKFNLINMDNKKIELVDIHNIDIGFNSLVNDVSFINTTKATVNIKDRASEDEVDLLSALLKDSKKT